MNTHCRLCLTRMRPVISRDTKVLSDVYGCEHCDNICSLPRCTLCAAVQARRIRR